MTALFVQTIRLLPCWCSNVYFVVLETFCNPHMCFHSLPCFSGHSISAQRPQSCSTKNTLPHIRHLLDSLHAAAKWSIVYLNKTLKTDCKLINLPCCLHQKLQLEHASRLHEIVNVKFAMIEIWPVFTAAGFLLSHQQDKHVCMQISLSSEYHICMPSSRFHLHITDYEGGKSTRKRGTLHTWRSPLTIDLLLMALLPLSQSRAGRAGASNKSVNRTPCFPRRSTETSRDFMRVPAH